MIDIKFIRENPEKAKENSRNKNVKVDIDKLLKLDAEKRDLLIALEDLRAKKNQANKEMNVVKNRGKIILQMQELDRNNDLVESKFKKISKEFNELLLQVPNICFDDVPVGKTDKDNIVIREIGDKPRFSFKPKDYLEIAENLDWIDIERAAKVSGTRFNYLKNEAVLLEFGLIDLAFNLLIKRGFVPIITPIMMKSEMARGMGYLEQTEEREAYYLPKDNLYLAGTTEQPIGAMHSKEILEDLPKRYVGFSSWFRREAGSYGKDTKGIFRVHQFDGVEMFSFCHPEKSREEHKLFLSLEEELMKLLKIPYQVVRICTGDMGYPAADKYDIESWFPSQNRYRETHSTSNCTDFQARRLNIRSKDKNFVHTVNGTAFAIGRTLIAIIENYQQKDGTVKIPEALKKYVRKTNFN